MFSQIAEDYRAVLIALSTLPNPPILIGRMAMVVHGSDQLTHDIDLVTPDFPDVLEILYRHGFRVIIQKNRSDDGMISYDFYRTEIEARYAIGLRNHASFQTVHPETGAELDIWLRPRIPYATLKASAQRAELGAVTLLVPNKENMIRLKEAAIADDPSRKSKDQWDIDFLRNIR